MTQPKRKQPIKLVAVPETRIDELNAEIQKLKKSLNNAQTGLLQIKQYAESPKYKVEPFIHKDDIIARIDEVLSWTGKNRYS
jgi:hypothetical protein